MGERQLVNGIRWWIRVGSPWRDVPAGYGRSRRVTSLGGGCGNERYDSQV
ncbi:hypothetical protein AB0J84_31820 [Micromonospora arborensis]